MSACDFDDWDQFLWFQTMGEGAAPNPSASVDVANMAVGLYVIVAAARRALDPMNHLPAVPANLNPNQDVPAIGFSKSRHSGWGAFTLYHRMAAVFGQAQREKLTN